jgi:hypothetical protein
MGDFESVYILRGRANKVGLKIQVVEKGLTSVKEPRKWDRVD